MNEIYGHQDLNFAMSKSRNQFELNICTYYYDYIWIICISIVIVALKRIFNACPPYIHTIDVWLRFVLGVCVCKFLCANSTHSNQWLRRISSGGNTKTHICNCLMSSYRWHFFFSFHVKQRQNIHSLSASRRFCPRSVIVISSYVCECRWRWEDKQIGVNA